MIRIVEHSIKKTISPSAGLKASSFPLRAFDTVICVYSSQATPPAKEQENSFGRTGILNPANMTQ